MVCGVTVVVTFTTYLSYPFLSLLIPVVAGCAWLAEGGKHSFISRLTGLLHLVKSGRLQWLRG